MCRLLAVRSSKPFHIQDHLEQFALISRRSSEYQGHGWGCSFLRAGEWKRYRSIRPVWEDELDGFGKSDLLIAHARSAFRNEGIVVENNMPFHNQDMAFVFNGEIRGVRLKVEGRTGAEKIFNLINRMDRGNLQLGIHRTLSILDKRSSHLKACNLIIAVRKRLYLATQFTERTKYFTMNVKLGDPLIICSKPYSNENNWEAVQNGTVRVY